MSFHQLFAELLAKTPPSVWRAQWAPPQLPSEAPDHAPAPRAPHQDVRRFFSLPLSCDDPTERPHTAPATAVHADDAALFYQTIKEVALAFAFVEAQEQIMAQETSLTSTEVEPTSGKTASVVLSQRAALQLRLQKATHEALQRVATAEADERALVRDVQRTLRDVHALHTAPRKKGHTTHPSGRTEQAEELQALAQRATEVLAPFSDNASRVDGAMHAPPITRWAGHAHFNPLTTNITAPRAPATHLAVPAVTTVPLFLSEDLVQQMTVYWRLHNEAEARARLHALRHKDASAYAEHVSLLKISALLQVMEKTHDFMKRIGENIKRRLERAGGGDRHGAAARAIAMTVPGSPQAASACTGSAQPSTAAAASEYQRFKAYVASANDDFKLIHPVDSFVRGQPVGLQATLLPHQLDGLRFLTSLHTNHINGILADEMGVGKTIQTLAFLLHLKESLQCDPSTLTSEEAAANAALSDRLVLQYNRTQVTSLSFPLGACRLPPHLVLAPLSVVREWKEACEQFVPDSLRVALWSDLHDPLTEAPLYDIVLLPIHAVRRLPPEARRIQFGYIVVDEAHKAVANLQTLTAECILQLRYWRRLVLTGTPLNSDLQELWSLLHFLNPDVFSTQDSFEEVFRRPFAVYDAREMDLTSEERGLLVLRLHQILRPFMLRRTKKDVDQSLRIRFHTLTCPLTTMQSALLRFIRVDKRTPCCQPADDDRETRDEDSDEDSELDEACAAGVHPESHATKVKEAPPQAFLAEATRAARVATRYRLTNSNVSESTAQALCNHALALPFVSQVLHVNGLEEHTAARPIAFAAQPVVTDGAATAEVCPTPHADVDVPSEALSVDPATDTVDPAASPLPTPVSTHSTTEDTTSTPCHGAAELALACSGKFLVLDLLLTRLAMAGRKAVLFTHWLDCLDLLADYLTGRGWGQAFEVLSGSTSEEARKVRVHRFRSDPSCLFFLLSIKAGGCGINLQTAHVVIMLDRDYTTTNEDQALARVYRIGQRHTVQAVYLSTLDTAEARVATRAEAKNKPRQAIIEDGTYQVVREEAEEVETEAEEGKEEEADSAVAPLVSGDMATSTLAMALWEALTATASTDDWHVLPSPLALQQQTQEAGEALAETSTKSPANPAKSASAAQQERTLLQRAFARLHKGFCFTDTRGETTSDAVSEQETEDSGRHRCIRQRMTDAAWSALHSLVCELDAVVCTEEDLRAGVEDCLLVPYRPPQSVADFEAQWASEDERLTDSATPRLPWQNAHAWAGVLLAWLDAVDGPGLCQHALHAAASNDATRQSTAYMTWCKQQRTRRRDARLALVNTVHPPQAFREQCWEDGIEDDVKICRLYLRAQAAQRERKQAAEDARLQRLAARDAVKSARAQAAELRAQRAEARRTQAHASAPATKKRSHHAPSAPRPRAVKRAKVEKVATTSPEHATTIELSAVHTPVKECASAASLVTEDASPAAGELCTSATDTAAAS